MSTVGMYSRLRVRRVSGGTTRPLGMGTWEADMLGRGVEVGWTSVWFCRGKGGGNGVMFRLSQIEANFEQNRQQALSKFPPSQ